MRICFIVSHPTLDFTGGAELQCSMIAQGLVDRGWDVVSVTRKDKPITERGYRIYHARKLLQGNRWPARYSRTVSLLRILTNIDPDVLIVTYSGSLAGLIAIFAILFKKKFIYRAASEKDADITFGTYGWHELDPISRGLHKFAVKKASVIIAGSLQVADAFAKYVPKERIRMIRSGQSIDSARIKLGHRNGNGFVLWMGRLHNLKNPMVFVNLAKELPHIQFALCGSGPLQTTVIEASSNITNLKLTGWVSGRAKDDLLEKAIVFVNTSIVEGFPNTLIEAGIHGIPYISFVDPDEVICREKLGFHVRSFSELVLKTCLLVNDSKTRTEFGSNIRAYVGRYHRIENTVSEYESMLKELNMVN